MSAFRSIFLAAACLVACALMILGGCKKPIAAPPAVANPVAAVPAVEAPASEPTPPLESEPAEPVAPPAVDESTESHVAESAAAAVPKSTERIVVLAPGQPLIVEYQLSIDCQPHTQALERLVDEVLKLGDTDGDGRTEWKELCASKKIKYGQYGNLAIDNENSERQIVERYDIARDGVVDRSELPRFLTRNAGASRPFSIRGTLNYRDVNRRGAPTWRVLDANGDGGLSAEERTTAATRLAGRDTDDDEILVASDINPRFEMPGMPMMDERRRRGPEAARLLGRHADWSAVQQSLEQEYGGGRFLRTGAFPAAPELFAALDKNGDGRLRRDEYAGLNDVPPHLVIAAEFGNRETSSGTPSDEQSEAAKPRLTLISLSSSLIGGQAAAADQPGRLTLEVGGTLLTFYVNDTVASQDFKARASQALAMFDQNKDGYLERDEVPDSLQGQLGRFEAVDADEDGKAFPHEIESFLSQQQAGLRAQIHARVTDREDALFAALDADHDERLTSQEVAGSAQRLAAFDKDANDRITPDELPEMLLIGLARGSVETPEATFAAPALRARVADENSPRWFTAMDANQDGVISRREFLGTRKHFEILDRDGSGLIDASELPSEAQ